MKRESKAFHDIQDPVLESKASGVILLGDFTPQLTQSPLALNQSPVDSVAFSDSQSMQVRDVLTNIRKWTYSEDYLANKVNEQLAEYFEDELGSAVARLKNDFEFPDDDVYVDDAAICFPGGRYWLEYVAEDKKFGKLFRHVTFSDTWFADSSEISDVLKALEISPAKVRLELKTPINLKGVVPGIRASGWTLTSQLENKVKFSQGGFHLTIEDGSLTFYGFSPSELFGDMDSKQSKLAGSVLMLVGRS